MRTIKTGLLLTLAAALSMGGCASFSDMGGAARGETKLSASPKVPSVEGTARFGRTKNDNTGIGIEVKHLADPKRLTPPATNYVVWVKESDKDPQNVGALAVDKELRGTLDTLTPHHSFELFITAEPSGEARAPTGERLLWTSFGG